MPCFGANAPQLAKLHKALGTTMIYVTHDQVEAMTLADRIVLIDGGVVAQVGAPLDLYTRPEQSLCRAFIGSPTMNFLAATAKVGSGSAVSVFIAGGNEIELRPRVHVRSRDRNPSRSASGRSISPSPTRSWSGSEI